MYKGVTMKNIRDSLINLYFCKVTNTQEVNEVLYAKNKKYVIPLRRNWENPIEADSNDTYIQFLVQKDERLGKDFLGKTSSNEEKLATIFLRFIGAEAESYAKFFHHIAERKGTYDIFQHFCNAKRLEEISPLFPKELDYFGNNATMAIDTSFKLRYSEELDCGWEDLEEISMNITGNIT